MGATKLVEKQGVISMGQIDALVAHRAAFRPGLVWFDEAIPAAEGNWQRASDPELTA